MIPFRAAALLLCLLPSASCIRHRDKAHFRVVPGSPDYLLESPDRHRIRFADTLRAFNGFERAGNWIDLRPFMELRIENAYYEPGASRRGLEGFLGTELARYELLHRKLRLLSVQSMQSRPVGDLSVDTLIPDRAKRFTHYRFYYEIWFRHENNSHGSALLGANSTRELQKLSDRLSAPETVCNGIYANCTVFPDACSVSLEMHITVNGQRQDVLWGSLLADVTNHPHHLRIRRLYAGHLLPIQIDWRDPKALQLPLLPGDRIAWD